ncbi:hypothetical protein Ddye_026155 [Dipteronia dyeriana]|uniref:DDE Tnp4 domain-containing protein n=1 Tax=Dipteronia dyeriana TaxID=168575 RepID=A0AAD9TLN7_9ROSI|nr:hypothetical protein Ddye_026155 [Dipteronia dyeriana]
MGALFLPPLVVFLLLCFGRVCLPCFLCFGCGSGCYVIASSCCVSAASFWPCVPCSVCSVETFLDFDKSTKGIVFTTDRQYQPGYYYVVDSGYINMTRFLTPYRGERYHLRDYEGPERAPRDPKELFNYRHSSL